MRRKFGIAAMIGAWVMAVIVEPAYAQIDLSGNWAPRNSSQSLMDLPGPEPGPVDYSGVPLNQAGLAASLMANDLQLSEPERICSFYPPSYLMLGPFGLRIWNSTEPLNGATLAWHIGGWEDLEPITIWMDGRAQPSRYAAHEMSGFATGRWQDDVLVVSITHMRMGIVRRNLAPLSDRATMTAWLLRHADELTVTARILDPIYLSQPYILTRTFELVRTAALPSVGQPCTVSNEGVAEGEVPFFPPGQNPNMHYMTERYGLPLQAVLGGAQTMYPQYRRWLKDHYTRVPKCIPGNITADCGGPGKYPRRD